VAGLVGRATIYSGNALASNGCLHDEALALINDSSDRARPARDRGATPDASRRARSRSPAMGMLAAGPLWRHAATRYTPRTMRTEPAGAGGSAGAVGRRFGRAGPGERGTAAS
jgi:hypothetical protein